MEVAGFSFLLLVASLLDEALESLGSLESLDLVDEALAFPPVFFFCAIVGIWVGGGLGVCLDG